MKRVIFSEEADKKFADYDLGKLIFNKPLNIYFDSSEFEKSIASLWHYNCAMCDIAPLDSFKKLEIHMRGEHNRVYCEICIADRKAFLPEQEIFDPKSIPLHLAEWSGGGVESRKSKKKGHPICKFCDRYYYGDDQLYEHLTKNHFTCFLCEKANVLYQYFKDYNKLRHHFIDEHFPCTHPECLEKKYIVFADDVTLKQHDISTHLDTSGMTKNQIRQATQINVNFAPQAPHFKNGKTGVNEYYTLFIQLFGKESANDIFEDLVSLLPDESKRESLKQLHNYMGHLEEQYPSLVKEPVNIWTSAPSSTLNQVKKRPTHSVISTPFIFTAPISSSAPTTTTTTTTSSTNSMASKIQNNRPSTVVKQPMRPRALAVDSDEDDDFPSLGGNMGGINGYFPSGATSTTNFSKLTIESKPVQVAPTVPKVATRPPKMNESDFPSLPIQEKKKKNKVKPVLASAATGWETKEVPKEPDFVMKKGKKKVILKF
eukprot:gene15053-17813_t